jgi:rubrerythrin
MDLKDSNTLQNLKDAFAGESQANRRYLYFAAKADVEGENDVAAVFRSTAEGETGHAHGHLEYMEEVGIADWFETLAKAERSHANRFQKALDAMG